MPSPSADYDNAYNIGQGPMDGKSRQRVLRKIFGVDDLEVSRNKAMIRLGVSNSDVEASALLFREGGRSRPVEGAYDGGSIEKVERMTGYAEQQLAREKAIQMLGTTEEDIDEHVSTALGKLGLPASFDLPQTTPLDEPPNQSKNCNPTFDYHMQSPLEGCRHSAMAELQRRHQLRQGHERAHTEQGGSGMGSGDSSSRSKPFSDIFHRGRLPRSSPIRGDS